jgi:hypothetical protein
VGKLVVMNSPTIRGVVIPASLGSNGSIIDIASVGAGDTVIVPGSGVTITSAAGRTLNDSGARAQRYAADFWVLRGNLGSSNPLVPSELAGLQLWLDASDTTTITEAGGSVSQWNDKSGNGNNVTQGTGALQPTTGVSTVNGLNVLNFAGDLLSAATAATWKFMHDGTVWFIGAVWQAGTTANPNVAYGLFGTNASSTTHSGVYFTYDDRTAVGGRDNNVVVFVTRSALNSFTVVSNTGTGFQTANTPAVTSALFDPSNGTAANRLSLQTNADTPVANNDATAAVSATDPTYPLQIGAAGNGVVPLTGKIAEIVIVSGAAATSTNREAVRDYLNAKWDVY